MKKINKITNIALIFILIWIFLCPDPSFAGGGFLRVPSSFQNQGYIKRLIDAQNYAKSNIDYMLSGEPFSGTISYESIKELFRSLHPSWKAFSDFLNSQKGKSGRIEEGYHSYEHPLEVAYLAYLVGKKNNYSNTELLEFVVAALLHDYQVRGPYIAPSVQKTLEYLKNDASLRSALEELQINIDHISLLIESTDFPWTEDRAKHFQNSIDVITDSEARRSLFTRAGLLQCLDKMATYVCLGPSRVNKRVEALYYELQLTLPQEKIALRSTGFLDALKKDPLFDHVLRGLPLWARENLDNNYSYFKTKSQITEKPREIKPVSYIWQKLFKENQIPMDGTVVEVAPGYETKIGDGLALLGFYGTIILIEPDKAAAVHVQQAYLQIMPKATVKVVIKPLQDVKAGEDIPLHVDALTANHPFDDMVIASAIDGAQPSFFSQERQDELRLTPQARKLYDAISDEDYVQGILSTVAVWKDFIQKLKPTCFMASQYPGRKLMIKGLTKRQDSGFIVTELLRDYFENYLKEQYEDKSFGYQGDPTWWTIARKPYTDLVRDLAEQPAAIKRLGEQIFVRQQARRLDPVDYDVVFADSKYFEDMGYTKDALSQAQNFAIVLDNDKPASPETIETYADRQKDETDIGLGGNIGSGRAVYYGDKYNVMGVGKTTLCTSTIPSHSTGKMELIGALRRVVSSRWINYFTKRAVIHPVVIALKETNQFKWNSNPVPLALLVRVDDGALDRPSHVEYSPEIAVDFQKCLTEYARLDAEYFAYRMMLGAWSTGNYSINGHMIDLETTSFVKYRGPYNTASTKYKEDFFGYEGLGFIKILRQLADVKGINDTKIEKRFYEERQQYLAHCFLLLLGVDETKIAPFISKHKDQVIALSDQFEKLAKKVSPKRTNLSLYSSIPDNEDPSLLDMSNLFRNLAALYEFSSDREESALDYLIRKPALGQIKAGIVYEPQKIQEGEVNQGEVFVKEHAVVSYDKLEEFLYETKSFVKDLFQLVGDLDSEKCLPERYYWRNRLQIINQDFPTMGELNDKLKYWVEEYRSHRVDSKTLGMEIEKLCQLPHYPTGKSFHSNDIPLLDYLKLNEYELEALSPYIKTVDYEQGRTIVRKGDDANSLFILVQGTCRVISGREEINRISNRGMLIGEAAIFTNGEKRTADVIAETPVSLLQIHRDGLEKIMTMRPKLKELLINLLKQKREGIDKKVLGLKIFEGINTEDVRLFLADKASKKHFAKGYQFIQEDKNPPGVYLLTNGSVTLSQSAADLGMEPIKLRDIPIREGLFGEWSVIYDQEASNTVVANENVSALFIPRDDFKELLNRHPQLLQNCLNRIRDYSQSNMDRKFFISELKTRLSSNEADVHKLENIYKRDLLDILKRKDGDAVLLDTDFSIERLFGTTSEGLKRKDVLVLGCGGGTYCFSAILKGVNRAVGVDFDENSIKVAKIIAPFIHDPILKPDLMRYVPEVNVWAFNTPEQRLKRVEPNNLEFIKSDARDLSFLENNSFDAVAIPFIIGIEDGILDENGMRSALQEAMRVLKPNGTLFIEPYFTEAQLPTVWSNKKYITKEELKAIANLTRIMHLLKQEGYAGKRLIITNDNNLFKIQMIQEDKILPSKETSTSLSNDQLIREAESAMPFCEDKNPDWARFNKIVKELKARKDLKIFIYAGPDFENKGGIDIDRKIIGKYDLAYIEKFWRSYKENNFVKYTVENIYQHVKPGIALVIEQEITTKKGNKYKEISVIDNGTGPIDKKGNEARLEDIIKFGVSIEIGGWEDWQGYGLSVATRCCADFSRLDGKNSIIVEGSEEMPGEDIFPPKIIWRNKSEKSYGFTVIGYFLGKGADKKDVKEDVIKRAEEYINLLNINQTPDIREKDIQSRKSLYQAV